MRDPTRIPAVLAELERVWKQTPDLRLAQVVSIAAHMGNPDVADVFYAEDDSVLRGLYRINGAFG